MHEVDATFRLAVAGRFKQAEAAAVRLPPLQRRWISAYIANARGDFRAALSGALAVSRAGGDDPIAAKALVTAGSALRQLGRHARARTLDREALARAPDASARAHAHIGLAADAVGLGDAAECEAQLCAAAVSIPRGDWRAQVRLAWVRCEQGLLEDRPLDACRHARSALGRSVKAGARRHEAKSLLFLGIAMRETANVGGSARSRARSDEAWVEVLRRARDLAEAIGARPIACVAADAIGKARPDERAGRLRQTRRIERAHR